MSAVASTKVKTSAIWSFLFQLFTDSIKQHLDLLYSKLVSELAYGGVIRGFLAQRETTKPLADKVFTHKPLNCLSDKSP